MTNKTFTAACVQINSGNDRRKNIGRAMQLIREAARRGADFIALPENTFFMAANREESFENAGPMKTHPAIFAMQALAKELKVWLLFGIIVHSGKKLANRSVLIDAKGEIVSHYDKIHLFDVNIEGGESHRESEVIAPGKKAVVAKLPWTKLGMTICYDLRFPHLFRKLAHAGAEVITVPAAFTYKTGEAHWHTLLRARAIENACYIIAPAQCGRHPRKRHTYGHSLIIDPWGKIIAEASEEKEGVILAEINLEKVSRIRASLPSLKHDRDF